MITLLVVTIRTWTP